MAAPSMSRQDRLRRVLILCCSFARNLAYYRIGRSTEYLQLQAPDRNPTFAFWRSVSGNFIDMCVLEWCKLFADKKGKHYWKNVVTNPNNFRLRLLQYLGTDETEFEKEIGIMLRYRDKFLAHLDSDLIMNIPALETAKKAVWFYYAHILADETTNSAGLPSDINVGYARTEDEARKVYQKAC